MVDVEFVPYDKIIFRSALKFNSPKELGESLSKGASKSGISTLRLLWANGVIFRATRYPSDAVIKEELKGIMNLNHVDFAAMDNYQESISISIPGLKIAVVDVSNHTLFGPLTLYIKNKFLK
jgi:hypothetical protein